MQRSGSVRQAGGSAARRLALPLALAVLLLAAGRLGAEGFLASTYLLDIHQGSPRSDAVRAISGRGYELSDGRPVDFGPWYGSDWRDFHLSFLTQVDEHLGLVWGFSTGERGEKYRITPGLTLGLVASVSPTPRSALTLTMTLQLGSDLSERSCRADYGAFGVVEQVNCRLAAAPLAPQETLRHLFRARGIDDSRIALTYDLRF